jgi:hypothetical protein
MMQDIAVGGGWNKGQRPPSPKEHKISLKIEIELNFLKLNTIVALKKYNFFLLLLRCYQTMLVSPLPILIKRSQCFRLKKYRRFG